MVNQTSEIYVFLSKSGEKSDSRQSNALVSTSMYPQVGLLQLGHVSTAELRYAKHSLTLETYKKLRR